MSEHGAKLPAKLLALKNMWCPNNGSSTPLHRAYPGVAPDDRRRLDFVIFFHDSFRATSAVPVQAANERCLRGAAGSGRSQSRGLHPTGACLAHQAAAAVPVAHNGAAGSPRRPSPPRLRCLRSDEQLRSFVLRRNPRLPAYSRWPPRPRCRYAGGGRACRGAPTQSRALPGVDPRRASTVVLAAEVGGRWSDECQQFLLPYSGRTTVWSPLLRDATLVSPLTRAGPTSARPHRMAQSCAPPGGANTPPTLSSLTGARKPSACSAARWVGGGAPMQ